MISASELRQPIDKIKVGLDGLIVEAGSTIQLVHSSARGGLGKQDALGGQAGQGGHGIEIRGGSRLWLVETSVWGGEGDFLDIGSLPGVAGSALSLLDGAQVDVRGAPTHLLVGDKTDAQDTVIAAPILCSNSLSGPTNEVLVHTGGVTLVGAGLPACLSSLDFVPPRLVLAGDGTPGSVLQARLFAQPGPAGGLPVVLFGSLSPALIDLPGLLGVPAFTNPALILTSAIGQVPGYACPAQFDFTLPSGSAMAGLRFYLQGVQVWAGALYGTNLQAIVLSW